ncbi:hypothetical protein K470DRAFT_255839, partial [Piedraia hortae CBS 480.64]
MQPSHQSLEDSQHDPYPVSAQQTAAAALSPSASDPATSQGRRKRPRAAPGSRGVANLNPEQLEKKRANDREAQRAIRKRTKATIEGLTNRIQELERQQPFQEIQRLTRERDQALQRCEALQQKLSELAQATSQVGPGGLNELAALTVQQVPMPAVSQAQPHSLERWSNGQTTAEQTQQYDPRLCQQQSAAPMAPVNAHVHDGGLSSPQPLRNNDVSQVGGAEQQANASSLVAIDGIAKGVMSTQSRPSPAIHAAAPPSSSLNPSPEFFRAALNPIWLRLPKSIPSENPFDVMLSDFIVRCRQEVSKGTPLHSVLGSHYPAFEALCGPEMPHRLHPLSAFLNDVLSQFASTSALPERAAILYLMFLVLRWHICPCEPCYVRLPAWARPTAEALQNEHPLWVDYIPWPSLRQRIMSEGTKNDVFSEYMKTLNVNWPYAPNHVFVVSNAQYNDAQVTINPVFEDHLRNLNHWSVKGELPSAVGSQSDSTAATNVESHSDVQNV